MYQGLRCSVVVALLAAAVTVADTKKGEPIKPPREVVEPLPGYYSVEGTQVSREGGPKPYAGVCMIDKVGEVYVCHWNVVGNSFSGVGLFRDGILAVGWSGEDKIKGAYSLKLMGDGSLEGRWVSMPGNGLQQRETLKFLRKLPAAKKEV